MAKKKTKLEQFTLVIHAKTLKKAIKEIEPLVEERLGLPLLDRPGFTAELVSTIAHFDAKAAYLSEGEFLTTEFTFEIRFAAK